MQVKALSCKVEAMCVHHLEEQPSYLGWRLFELARGINKIQHNHFEKKIINFTTDLFAVFYRL